MSTFWTPKDRKNVYIKYQLRHGGKWLYHRTDYEVETRRAGKAVIPRAAIEYKRQFDDQLAQGKIGVNIVASRIRFSELAKKYRRENEHLKKPKSWELYECAIKSITPFLKDDPRVDEVTPKQLFHWVKSLREKNQSTASTYLRQINPIFNMAVEVGLIQKNPINKDVNFKPPKKLPEPYTESEYNLILTYTHRNLRPLNYQLRFMLYGLARPGDSCTFKRHQIDMEAKVMRYYNNKENRWEFTPLWKPLRELFEEMLAERDYAPDDFMFHHRTPKRIYDSVFRYVLPRIPEFAGRKFARPVHKFKKTGGNIVAALGIDGNELRDMLHHVDRKTSDDYYLLVNTEALRKKLDGEDLLTVKQLVARIDFLEKELKQKDLEIARLKPFEPPPTYPI